jgi:hypothetical protein
LLKAALADFAYAESLEPNDAMAALPQNYCYRKEGVASK